MRQSQCDVTNPPLLSQTVDATTLWIQINALRGKKYGDLAWERRHKDVDGPESGNDEGSS
jgi:hypothetical protein